MTNHNYTRTVYIYNPLTPWSDQHVISPYHIFTFAMQTSDENKEEHQLKEFFLDKHQIQILTTDIIKKYVTADNEN